jgi:thioredoxin-like negative regulator of GroEL
MGFFRKLFGGGEPVPVTSVRTLAEFQAEVMESAVPVIVNVWSVTCGPCRKLHPVLEQVSTEYAGRVKVVEIETAADPAVLQRLEVRATPTIIVVEGGDEIGRMTGFRPKGWFDEMIATEFPA